MGQVLHLRWTELGVICPNAVEQNSEIARDRDDSVTWALGTFSAHLLRFYLLSSHCAHGQCVGRSVQRYTYILIHGIGNTARIILFTRLIPSWCQTKVPSNGTRAFEAGGIIDCRLKGQSRYWPNTGRRHHLHANRFSLGGLLDAPIQVKEVFVYHDAGIQQCQHCM